MTWKANYSVFWVFSRQIEKSNNGIWLYEQFLYIHYLPYILPIIKRPNVSRKKEGWYIQSSKLPYHRQIADKENCDTMFVNDNHMNLIW